MVSVCTVPARGGRSCEHFGGYKTINRIPLEKKRNIPIAIKIIDEQALVRVCIFFIDNSLCHQCTYLASLCGILPTTGVHVMPILCCPEIFPKGKP